MACERRYGERLDDPVCRQRLDYELGVIHQMGFDTYFLIVWDLVSLCARTGHLVQRPWFGCRFHRCLHAGYHHG